MCFGDGPLPHERQSTDYIERHFNSRKSELSNKKMHKRRHCSRTHCNLMAQFVARLQSKSQIQPKQQMGDAPQHSSLPAEIRHVTRSGAVLTAIAPLPLIVMMRLRTVGCQLKSATASPSACCFSVVRCEINFVPHASRSVSRVCRVSYRVTYPSSSKSAPRSPGRVGHHASRVTFSRRSVMSVFTGSLNCRMSHTLTAWSVPVGQSERPSMSVVLQ